MAHLHFLLVDERFRVRTYNSDPNPRGPKTYVSYGTGTQRVTEGISLYSNVGIGGRSQLKRTGF
jgi:hypothetical protein